MKTLPFDPAVVKSRREWLAIAVACLELGGFNDFAQWIRKGVRRWTNGRLVQWYSPRVADWPKQGVGR